MNDEQTQLIIDGLVAKFKAAIDPLRLAVSALTDQNAALQKALNDSDERVKSLENAEPPKEYDDSELKHEIASLRANQALDTEAILKRIPASYDDSAILADIEKLKSDPDPMQGIADRLKALESVKAYDDTKMAAAIAELKNKPEPDFSEVIQKIDGINSHLTEQIKQLQQRPEHGLQVRQRIDVERVYAAGTWAKHAGGLWRSFEETDGMRGWECIVDGVKSINTQQDSGNPRIISVTTEKSSGATSTEKFNVPAQIYKGVWDGGNHVEGDTVTSSGNLWYAKRDTSERPGAGNDDWQLAVRKGKDFTQVRLSDG